MASRIVGWLLGLVHSFSEAQVRSYENLVMLVERSTGKGERRRRQGQHQQLDESSLAADDALIMGNMRALLFNNGLRRVVVNALAADYTNLMDDLTQVHRMLISMHCSPELADHYLNLMVRTDGIPASVYDRLYENWKLCVIIDPVMRVENDISQGQMNTLRGIRNVALRSFHRLLSEHLLRVPSASQTAERIGELMLNANEGLKLRDIADAGMEIVDQLEKPSLASERNATICDMNMASVSSSFPPASLPSVPSGSLYNIETISELSQSAYKKAVRQGVIGKTNTGRECKV